MSSATSSQRPNAAVTAVELSDDAFLDGRVEVWQPKSGFRAGMDSVMLAAAVKAKSGDTICDLGSGVGTASLCLAARVGGLHLTAVELEETYAELAEANFARNAFTRSHKVITADILKRPRSIPRQSFNHVLTNPPFFDVSAGTRAPGKEKAQATSITAEDLAIWLKFARALVRPKGTLTAIMPATQLPLALSMLSPQGLGFEILPLWPKQDAPAKRLIIRHTLNRGAPLQIKPGLVLHQADGKPSEKAEAILRRGEALIT